jgi:hypothetical protein
MGLKALPFVQQISWMIVKRRGKNVLADGRGEVSFAPKRLRKAAPDSQGFRQALQLGAIFAAHFFEA